MIKGGIGGGSTLTGLKFEGKVDISTFLSKQKNYNIKEINKNISEIFYENEKVGDVFKKHGLYTYLNENNIDYKKFISKKLLPDDCLYVISKNTAHIIEVKYQEVAGSVDEKLQTCDFKRKQYKKIFSPLNIEVEYIYLLNDWFKKPEYKDVLDYIESVYCYYYFNYIPLDKLGLPIPKT